jgi:hypothetical protein
LSTAAEVSKGSVKSLVGAANPFKSAPFGILIVGSMDVAEWTTSEDPFNNLSDLFAMLGVDLVKFGLASAGGVAAGALLIAMSPIIFGTTATVGAVILTVLGAGIGVSYALELIDASYGVTQSAKDGLNTLEKQIEDNYTPPQRYRSDVPAWLLR